MDCHAGGVAAYTLTCFTPASDACPTRMHFEFRISPCFYPFLFVAGAIVVTSPFLSIATQQIVHPFLASATALVVIALYIKQTA